MQNKATSQPSEALPVDGEKPKDQELLVSSSDDVPGEEQDPEDDELKKEALKAAQDAVSKQKRLTSAFDNECLKLRQAAEPEVPSQDASGAAGSSNIDLLHPWVVFFLLFCFLLKLKVLAACHFLVVGRI